MALNNFIPKVWSARILEQLRNTLVFGQAGIVNRDYQGEISQAGDTVYINSIGDITVKDYDRNEDIDPPEQLTSTQRALVIDQEKYFNFAVDDVDAAQMNVSVMNNATQGAAFRLAEIADEHIASLYTQAGMQITGVLSAANFYQKLLAARTQMNRNNIPAAGRFAVLPPEVAALALDNDRVVKDQNNSDNEIQNGVLGRILGFTLVESNSTALGSKIFFGHSMAWSYAEQVNKVEAYRPDYRFADALKGLHVYGAKVIRPSALGVLTNAA